MLKYYINQLFEYLDGLQLSARLAIFIGVYIVVSVMFYWFSVAGTLTQIEDVNQQIRMLKHQNIVLKAHAQRFQDSTTQEQKEKITKFENKLSKARETLNQYKNSILAPKQLVIILESILKQEPNVTVKRLQKQGSEKLKVGKNNQNIDAENIERLRYSIEYTGDFMNTYDYMQRLKQLPWHIFWERMNYRVKDYPRAHIKLKIAALIDQGE